MSLSVSRRSFLRGSALLPLLFAARLPLSSARAAYMPIKRIDGSHLRTSLNAFSFVELLNANAKDRSKGLDLFGVCDFCAQHNFDAVDLTGYFFPGYPGAPEDQYLYALKRHAFDRGLAISGTGVRNDFTAANPKTRAEGVARAKTWIQVAAKLGAPTIRVFADSQPPFKSWQEASAGADRATVEGWVADALRECAIHGEKFGVIVAVQNHGDFLTSAAEHRGLLERVDHRWCGAMLDTGNYLTADPYQDIAQMAQYAVNWQIKENLQSTLESPRVDLNKLLKIIRLSGYRGYLPIETLSMHRAGYDSYVEIAKMHDALRAAITATEPAA